MIFSYLYLFFQHFIQSNVMEDGQVAGEFAPDRAEEDPEDLEYHGIVSESKADSDDDSFDENDDDEEADKTTAVGATDTGAADQGGTRTPSFE